MLIQEPIKKRNTPLTILLIVGFTLLIGVWYMIYWSELFFTEAHLAGYYCCVTEQDLPPAGTLARYASDFFHHPIGEKLPFLLFAILNVGLFYRFWQSWGTKRMWLPFFFASFGIFYLFAELSTVSVSWGISNSILGQRTTPYAGYERTWYGIVLHLMIWVAYFAFLLRYGRRWQIKDVE